MDYLPIFIRLKDKPCIVIGGGEIAARKASRLLKAGARVTVVAPTLSESLKERVAAGQLTHYEGIFHPDQLDHQTLAIAATDDPDVNRQVFESAQDRNLPVNVVDTPEYCTFIMPSIIDRSPVVVAVSTGGASPVFARLLRARLETLIPSTYGRLATLAMKFRDKVKQRIQHPAKRRHFWEEVLQGSIAEMVYSGQEDAARDALDKKLNTLDGTAALVGEIYLVGAGPGDPDLLTFRALRLMQQADVVVYDRLVSPAVLELVRHDADKIYAGKERDHHALPQEDINQLLVRLAREGKKVVRLKGGDPFIFGRGGEEIDTLAAEGIPFQVVPGITAASGCASYAGIPLTHRDYAQSVAFVAGHMQDGSVNLNWKELVQSKHTLVFYMGLQGIETICHQLIKHGLPPSMPAALVQQGTTPHQRVLTGTLDTLSGIVQNAKVKAPTLIIVGEVVKLRDKLNWFHPTAAN